MLRIITPIALSLVIGACAKESPPAPQTAAPAPKPQPKAVAPAQAPEPSFTKEDGFVKTITSIRRVASDDQRITDPAGKSTKKVSNWLATLYRGERVSVLEREGDWVQVKASDDTEGWMRTSSLIPSDNAILATNLEAVRVFSRPERAALKTGRNIEAGTLLFMMEAKDDFRRVNYGTADTWIKAEGIVEDKSEIEAAKLLYRIRHMQKKKDPEVKELIELAHTEFKESKVIALLDGDGTKSAGTKETPKEKPAKTAPAAAPQPTTKPDEPTTKKEEG